LHTPCPDKDSRAVPGSPLPPDQILPVLAFELDGPPVGVPNPLANDAAKYAF
jgi:hypothetical protein